MKFCQYHNSKSIFPVLINMSKIRKIINLSSTVVLHESQLCKCVKRPLRKLNKIIAQNAHIILTQLRRKFTTNHTDFHHILYCLISIFEVCLCLELECYLDLQAMKWIFLAISKKNHLFCKSCFHFLFFFFFFCSLLQPNTCNGWMKPFPSCPTLMHLHVSLIHECMRGNKQSNEGHSRAFCSLCVSPAPFLLRVW